MWHGSLGTLQSPRLVRIITSPGGTLRMYTQRSDNNVMIAEMYTNMGSPEETVEILASMAAAICQYYEIDPRAIGAREDDDDHDLW